MSAGIEWDDARGRYVNRAMEAVQERHRLASVFRGVILDGGDLPEVIAATLENTPASSAVIVAALVQAAQDAAHNGDAEEGPIGAAVAGLLAAWLTQTALDGSRYS